MIKKLKYIKFKDILGILIFAILILPSILYKFYIKLKYKDFWIVSELSDTCRDNGYHFFKYLRTYYPDKRCYYIIDKKCDDYKKIEKYGNIINFGSFKHWLYYMSANKIIVTDKSSDPDHPLFYFLHKYLNLYNNIIFLQHGVIKDNIPMFYYKNTRFRLFICGAKKEYDYILKKFGYPKENVVYTGLARFDNLNDNKIIKNQILIMPTWRNWIGRETNFLEKTIDFKCTNYFIKWNEILNSSDFIDYVENNNLMVKFYPHHQMQKFINLFESKSKNIIILDNSSEDIQDLLKSSALLITDYSSVFMDFAYMLKPVIYYQFDNIEYRDKQLQEGYFDYKKDGFGPVLESADDVISEIKNFEKIFNPKKKYINRMKTFFKLKDTNNCKRIYEEIIKIK